VALIPSRRLTSAGTSRRQSAIIGRLRDRASHEIIAIGAMIVATGTCAFAQGGYWVVGNRAISKCEIVTSNPVINAWVGGNIF
jgi:hypothetical protein